jgi:hypothetical protein
MVLNYKVAPISKLKLFLLLYLVAGMILTIVFLGSIIRGNIWEVIAYYAVYAGLGMLFLLFSIYPKQDQPLIRKIQSIILSLGIIISGCGIIGGTAVFTMRAALFYKNITNPTTTIIAESTLNYLAFPKAIRCTNGSLWAVWYVGNNHIDTNNDGKIASAWSHDGGLTWTDPIIIADHPLFDVRNPAIMEKDGQYILTYLLYDRLTRACVLCEFQTSTNGIVWSAPQEIHVPGIAWMSPFHNFVIVNGEYYAAFYGGEDSANSESSSFLLYWNSTGWEFKCFIAKYNSIAGIGFDETTVSWNGTHGIAIMRTSGAKNTLHVTTSLDGICEWGISHDTGIMGHAPDSVVLSNNCLYVTYREVKSLTLEARIWNPNNSPLESCVPERLFTYRSTEVGDCAYPSLILNDSNQLSIIHYEISWDFLGITRTSKIYFQTQLLG